MTLAVGIDLGGSNLRAALVAPDGALLASLREPVGDVRDPASIAARIEAAVDELAQRGGLAPGAPLPVGIGLAAMLRDRRGTVVNSPHLGWREVAFGDVLGARLGPHRPAHVFNDANAITWGEHVAGAGVGIDDVLAVYVGTGIGAGVIARGQLVDGHSHCAGELGHVKVAWGDDAAPCACGQRGCVEAYVGGRAVATAITAALTGPRPPTTSAVALAGGDAATVTPGHVDAAAGDGDAWALELWSRLAPLLAVALGNAVAILNPRRLILGGGMLSRTPVLRAQVEVALMLAAPIACTEALEIVDAVLGDDAGLVGAADLARRG